MRTPESWRRRQPDVGTRSRIGVQPRGRKRISMLQTERGSSVDSRHVRQTARKRLYCAAGHGESEEHRRPATYLTRSVVRLAQSLLPEGYHTTVSCQPDRQRKLTIAGRRTPYQPDVPFFHSRSLRSLSRTNRLAANASASQRQKIGNSTAAAPRSRHHALEPRETIAAAGARRCTAKSPALRPCPHRSGPEDELKMSKGSRSS